MINILNKESLKFLDLTEELVEAINNKNMDVVFNVLSKQYYLDLEFIKTITSDFTNKNVVKYFIPKNFKKELNTLTNKTTNEELNLIAEKYTYLIFNKNISITIKESILDSVLDFNNKDFKRFFNEKMIFNLNQAIKFENMTYNKNNYFIYNYILFTSEYRNIVNVDSLVYNMFDLFETLKNNVVFIKKIYDVLNILHILITEQKSFDRYFILLNEFNKNEIIKSTNYGDEAIYNYDDVFNITSKILQNSLNNDYNLLITEEMMEFIYPDFEKFKSFVETTFFKVEYKRNHRKIIITNTERKMLIPLKTLTEYKSFYTTTYGKIVKENYLKQILNLFNNSEDKILDLNYLKLKIKETDGVTSINNFTTSFDNFFNFDEIKLINNTIINSKKIITKEKEFYSEKCILNLTKVIYENIIIKYNENTSLNKEYFTHIKGLYDFYITDYISEKDIEINQNVLINCLKTNYILRELDLTDKTILELDTEKELIISNLTKESIYFLKVSAFKNYKENKTIFNKTLYIDFLNLNNKIQDFYNKEIFEEKNKKLLIITSIKTNFLDNFYCFLDYSKEEEIVKYFITNIDNKMFKQVEREKIVDIDNENINFVLETITKYLLEKDCLIDNLMLLINRINIRKVLEKIIEITKRKDVLESCLNLNNNFFSIDDKKIIFDLVNKFIEKNVEKNVSLLPIIEKTIINEEKEKSISLLINLINQHLS